MRDRILAAASALALPLVLFAVGTAAAQTESGLEVHIREVSFDDSGHTRVVVSVAGPALPDGPLSAESFALTEQGTAVADLTAEPLADTTQQVAVALLVDVSRSTVSRLPAAKAAAKRFVDGLPPTVRAGLFAFGSTVRQVVEIGSLGDTGSGKRNELGAAIDALTPDANTGTRLYDAVVDGTVALRRVSGAQANTVIFSDGADAGSAANAEQAVSALKGARAAATTVLLSTRQSDEVSLRALADAVDGGSLQTVENEEGLQAAFEGVAQAIASQYALTYLGTAQEPQDLNIGVQVSVGSVTGSDTVAVINQRPAVADAAPHRVKEPIFGNATLLVAILAIFLSLALFLGMLLYAPAGKRAEKMLQRGLRLYTPGAKKKKREHEGGALSGTAFGRAAVGIAERVPRSKEFDQRMQLLLDKAGWPLRSTEFLLIQAGALVAGSLLGFVLLRSPFVGIVLTALGAAIPRLVLSTTIQRRESAFLSQLPDTLQLLSGSLQAGYGFMQALDTVSKEANVPTSTEFARVLAEARLGMPVEEALDEMADRVGGEDFKWVVLAINIQRQVGGNLAALLSTVADTLREREQVRRQIKVLSAEGRLSAIILTALPFVLVGYLSVVNPEYLGSLTEETAGKIAIVIALVLMGIGGIWMRKVIKIDV